jgi:hypothetical protein
MTGAVEPIEVEFDFADVPLRQLMRRVQSFHRPNRAVQILVSASAWLVLTLGFLGLFRLGDGYEAKGPEFAVIGFAAGMVATVLVLMLLTRATVGSHIAALLSAQSRQGRVRVVLDANGLEYRSQGLSTRQSWDNIQEVVVVGDFAMVMPSHAEFYPIPHAGLPAGMSPDGLLDRIASWRKERDARP